MRHLARRVAALVMAVTMMAVVFVGNGVTAHAYGNNTHEDLGADMLIGENTTHQETYKAAVGDSLSITGQLDIYPIKKQIREYTAQLYAWLLYKGAVNGLDLNKVYLYDGNIDSDPIGQPGVRCSFVATFDLPEGLTVSDNCGAILNGSDLFDVGGTTYDAANRRITVTIPIKKVYATYQSLKNDIDTLHDGDRLNVTLTGITVADDAIVGNQYTVSGAVTGSLWTNMRVELKDRTSYTWPQFSWTGVQTSEGADVVDSDGIKLTYEVVEKR